MARAHTLFKFVVDYFGKGIMQEWTAKETPQRFTIIAGPQGPVSGERFPKVSSPSDGFGREDRGYGYTKDEALQLFIKHQRSQVDLANKMKREALADIKLAEGWADSGELPPDSFMRESQ